MLRASEWEAACKQWQQCKAKAILGFNFSFVTVSDSVQIKHSCVQPVQGQFAISCSSNEARAKYICVTVLKWFN